MLASLIRLSIRHAGVIVSLALLLLVYGGYRYSQAGLDIFPEFAPKRVIIQTEAPGFAVEQVELLVTQPIENAIRPLIGLQDLRSESIQGLSVITATFSDNSDIFRDRQLVTERLTQITHQLPSQIAPIVVPLSSSSATVLTLGLSSDTVPQNELRSIADWTLMPRLLAVSDVADVNVFGGDVRQIQIQVNPDALRRFDLSLEQVIQAAQQATDIRGVGFIENQNQRFSLQVSGQPNVASQFQHIPVKHLQGQTVTLADVAELVEGVEPPISAAQIMVKPGVVMMVLGQYGANTLEVSRHIESVLQGFAPLLEKQGIHFYSHLFRPADYIETSVHNLSGHLLIGCGFVVLVLYVFLFNLRSALIAALAIPLSLITAVLLLLVSGNQLNIMVLGGLAIALGEVVDDAIIDTENIFRRLRLNHQQGSPQSVNETIYQASLEVRSSVVYASFIVALVFVPLLTLSGVAGRLFAPLGYAYILAILMSLLIALTLTPALCTLLLVKNLPEQEDTRLLSWLKRCYAKQLNWIDQHFKLALGLGWAICLMATLAFWRLDHQFLPDLREGHFIVHTASTPGTSLSESIRIGSQLTQRFLATEQVESVSQWAGRAERGADTYGSHYSEYEVRLKPATANQQQVLESLRAVLNEFPGLSFEANTFLTERIDETISGYAADVVVHVYGNDLQELDTQAQQVAEIMEKLDGAHNIQVRSPPTTPMLDVHLNLQAMQMRGISPEAVINVLQSAYDGAKVGKVLQGNRSFSVAVTLAKDYRQQLESLQQLVVSNSEGQRIPLPQLVDIRLGETRYNILHQGGLRVQTITGHIEDADMDEFTNQLKQRLTEQLSWRSDLYFEMDGAALEQNHARLSLLLDALLIGSGVMILIYLALGSIRHSLITLLNLPFALVGGVAALVITDGNLSVGSFVGFITLFGITVRNSIMLISHYRHLIEDENATWNHATVLRGAQERLPSILMTALVTGLAMLPIAIGSDNPGREIMGPMATIIIGGLFTSTVLNLLLMPVLLKRLSWHSP